MTALSTSNQRLLNGQQLKLHMDLEASLCQRKMSPSFSINATDTQSPLAASPLTYFVRVLSELQAGLNGTALHFSAVKGTCHVTSNLTNICNRMESSKQQRMNKRQIVLAKYSCHAIMIWYWRRHVPLVIIVCLSTQRKVFLKQGSLWPCATPHQLLPFCLSGESSTLWKANRNYEWAECHFAQTQFSVTLGISIFTSFSLK